jgi:hypothetical protein
MIPEAIDVTRSRSPRTHGFNGASQRSRGPSEARFNSGGVGNGQVEAVSRPGRELRRFGAAPGLVAFMSEDFDAPLDEFAEYGP